jgi:hypothetical protein
MKPKIREPKDIVRRLNEMLEAGLVTFVDGRAEVVKETRPSLSKPEKKKTCVLKAKVLFGIELGA